MTSSKGRLMYQLAGMLVVMLLACMVLPRVAFAADTHEMWSEDKHWCRIWGETALDTMQAVVGVQKETAFADKRDGTVIIATSDGYWDALTGAALCGQQSSVLVLVSTTDGYTAFDAVYDPAQVIEGHVFGGRAAVSDASLEYFKAK